MGKYDRGGGNIKRGDRDEERQRDKGRGSESECDGESERKDRQRSEKVERESADDRAERVNRGREGLENGGEIRDRCRG